jgi:hypothetical protein
MLACYFMSHLAAQSTGNTSSFFSKAGDGVWNAHSDLGKSHFAQRKMCFIVPDNWTFHTKEGPGALRKTGREAPTDSAFLVPPQENNPKDIFQTMGQHLLLYCRQHMRLSQSLSQVLLQQEQWQEGDLHLAGSSGSSPTGIGGLSVFTGSLVRNVKHCPKDSDGLIPGFLSSSWSCDV